MSFASDRAGPRRAGAPAPGDAAQAQAHGRWRCCCPISAAIAGRALAALAALIVAALTTLVVPIAVRRMIDFGFSARRRRADRQLFHGDDRGGRRCSRCASALRYYLVTTLGERIVADLRADVFAHLTRLSPAFFDNAQTGEMVSRLTADTTQIKSAVGASVSIALRNCVLFLGGAAMMVVTSPRLSLFVLGAIPVIVLPLVAFGRAVRRRSRAAQDTLADASAYAAELIGAVRTLQAYTNETAGAVALRRARSSALTPPRASTAARAHADRGRDLSGVRQRRRGAVGRRAGCAGGHA